MRTKIADQATGGRNTRVAQDIPAVFQDAAGDAQHPYHSQSVSNLHQSNFQTRANHPGTPKPTLASWRLRSRRTKKRSHFRSRSEERRVGKEGKSQRESDQ